MSARRRDDAAPADAIHGDREIALDRGDPHTRRAAEPRSAGRSPNSADARPTSASTAATSADLGDAAATSSLAATSSPTPRPIAAATASPAATSSPTPSPTATASPTPSPTESPTAIEGVHSAEVPRTAGLSRDREGRVLLRGGRRAALEAWLVGDLGATPSEARRIFTAIHRGLVAEVDAIPRLRPELRARLRARARVDAIALAEVLRSADGTRKLVFTTDEGARIESVLIPSAGHTTICLSSQVGCAMRCHFCLTAKMGLHQNLSTAAIVDQVVLARRLLGADEDPSNHLKNVVFMGMGEPLHNLDAVVDATHVLVDPEGLGLSSRRVTVSTSGLVPAIDRLAAESPARLAVSLNATTDAVRDWLMPVNRKYPIAALLDAVRRFPRRGRERVVVEYVLLAGVNDGPDDLERLADLLGGLACKVNLIAWNPHPGSDLQRPTEAAVIAFRDGLRARRITAAIRRTRGDAAMAACGQLGRPPEADPPRSAAAPARRGRPLPIAPEPT
ncbi:MAG: 23S rRNA (adenine(2503)-C(2))-methyltransferase RlmN [Nannocystaceae bacterium]